MLHIFDFTRDFTILAVFVRLFAAMLCGGAIGIERELKRRPAGFRTHILICLGAAMTTLTSQYLLLEMNQFTDVARLGAQVICGIGFIGAGTIIVIKGHRVQGLTTAAGLWANAIIGLVCGAGYIEGALAATLLVIIAEVLLIKLEYRFEKQKIDVNIYVEYSSSAVIEEIVRIIKQYHINILDLEITRIAPTSDGNSHYCAILTIQAMGKETGDTVKKAILELNGVSVLEEL